MKTKVTKTQSRFTRSSGNVFADIGLRNAEEHRIRADIAALIGRLINHHNLTQNAAAVKLGIAQPDVSRILRGQLSGYSLEKLLTLVRALGNDVEIKVKPAKNARAGRILMSA
jgi:predicted XRE-type DNA-binding protein